LYVPAAFARNPRRETILLGFFFAKVAVRNRTLTGGWQDRPMNIRSITGTLLILGAIVVAQSARLSMPSENEAKARPSEQKSAGAETVQLFSAFGSGRNTDALAGAPSSIWPDVKLPTIKKSTKSESAIKAKAEPVIKKGGSKPYNAKIPVRMPTQVSNSGHIL
jgi:hypothetical protein